MKNGIVEAVIASNRRIAEDVLRMELIYKDAALAAPGQFINIYLREKNLLLPRPISVCDAADGALTLVYGVVGAGTRAMADYAPGSVLRVGAPCGNGFNVSDARGFGRVTLIGGGIGVPPLLMLAKALKTETDASVRAVLGFKSETFLADEFRTCCDETLIATEDGSEGFHGNVLELLKEENLNPGGDYFYSCGPLMMLRALSRFAGGQGIPLQVSLEARMGCGYGACKACICVVGSRQSEGLAAETATVNKRICVDGPVFFGNEVIWDV
ncbi:MAG: dihydroorotate dehydrogenase electron transfer subunit [Clostridiales Family XIII bacterium]|jgi:dihydroorotate dehydrogenase electron transfer subunit|nr:dihydroorotate dehydrogenase electron transfer subunit [Clostridiales Family XIII bacterium]